MELIEFETELNIKKKIVIYGAGIVAYGIYTALKALYGINCPFFVVSDLSNHREKIGEVRVRCLTHVATDLKDRLVLIATPEQYHSEINETLLQQGVFHSLFIDSHLEYLIMGAYYKSIGQFSCVSSLNVPGFYDDSEKMSVYMAVSHRDRKLSGSYEFPCWLKKIQVGAVLADVKTEALTDDTGQNISGNNDLYGELTATYWIWKNDRHRVTGLYHYRRVLIIDTYIMKLLDEGKIDVMLPLPFLCFHDTSWQYSRYLCPEDIDVMKQVLKEHSPDYYEASKEILSSVYLYNYNILVAKKEVFDDYCEWLFPLLKEIEKRCGQFERKRMERYIGRIGEILTSLYFLYNKRNWNIQHTEKKWLV